MYEAPYPIVLKPYGTALLALARTRPEIVCLSGDLTRQCEVDLFRDELPHRFVNAGMAEANMVGMAAALAREGLIPFVHTFGVFATRRPLDQIINAVAIPKLPVRLVGFMPGLSSPGGPSHQAVDDVALMRAIPGMTVVDVADAVQARQVAAAVVDLPGPVYLRLKRGDTPEILTPDYQLDLSRADLLFDGDDVAIFASGMMLSVALAAASFLRGHAISVAVVNVAVIEPIDAETVARVSSRVRVVVTAENHLIKGGLGSAVAEVLAGIGQTPPLHRFGIRDTYGEAALTAGHLFQKYGLTTQDLVATCWRALDRPEPLPVVPPISVDPGEYAPV